MAAMIPCVVENNLDAIQCTSSGRIILGSSNLTGRYWNGSLWCFKDVNDAPDVEKCITGIELTSGVCDLLCIDESRVAVAEESGSLELYQFSTEPPQFTSVHSTCEHEDSVLSISLNSDKSNIVSAGSDKCVKIWDLENWISVATYRPVHSGMIWQVSCSSVEPHIFITCGQDGQMLVFDLRQPKPATIIRTGPKTSQPTAVSWVPKKSFEFASGYNSGHIALNDLRKDISISTFEAHKRQIFRLAFSPVSSSWIASCADDTNVCVMDVEKESPTVIYKDNRHDDFVRGLTWSNENSLITCGWDKKVLEHIILPTDVQIATS